MKDKERLESSVPICDFIRDYAAQGTSRFHMPGHKGRFPFLRFYDPDILGSAWAWDITEIKGADSLYEAEGIICESERFASRLFGTAASFYSVEGSSQCIRAMLALAARYDRDPYDQERPVILAARNVHRSFITACALLDLDVEWLFPEEGSFSICACPVNADQVRTRLSIMERKPAAVYITSPDYIGNIQDIASISQAAHEHDVPLIVDNAHGAYLHFLEKPVHPIDLGADMCCDSAHKTLPSLTGCAYLHISEKAPQAFIINARRALSMFGSTSPSYLLLSSLDHTNRVLSEGWDEALSLCVRKTQDCKNRLKEMGWYVYGADDPGSSEPLKITVISAASGYSADHLADILRRNNIECEYHDPDLLVLMTSPYNTDQDFKKLIDAMGSVKCMPAGSFEKPVFPAASESVISIREAAFAPQILIPADQSAGRICADTAISCPPAIPVAVCGERITKDLLPVFRHYGITGISVLR